MVPTPSKVVTSLPSPPLSLHPSQLEVTGEKDYHSVICSDTFRHFLGGWMKYTPEVMPFLAPTINSYKRYQAASWAPTRLAWSPDNRTTGFRVRCPSKAKENKYNL